MAQSTLLLYRVVNAEDGRRAFSTQSEYPAGRWTTEETPAIYASRSAATALLEKLAHRKPGVDEFEMVVATMPASLLAAVPDVPEDWREWPYRKAVQRSGDAWLAEHAWLAVPVPSALVDGEVNVLIDPLHSQLSSITIIERRRFEIDRRLL